jgi:hypothetical protein
LKNHSREHSIVKIAGRDFLFAVLLGLGMGITSTCTAQYGQADDLPVKTYPSPSGHLILRVDPSQRSGAGKANYLLRQNGKRVWSGEWPFTLWQAVVSDDGTVSGYAYSHGINQDDGEFIVVIFAPDGELRMAEKTPRTGSRFLHTLGDPKALDLFLDTDNDRLVVRVDDPDLNESSESWWTWRVSDAKSIGKFKPRDLMADASSIRFAFDARPLAGTPLTLIHWYRDGCRQRECNNRRGARFALVDTNAKPVWTLDLPTDYTNTRDDKAQDRIFDEMREHGAILDTSRSGHFEIRQIATRQRLSFSVERDDAAPTHWKVSKTGASTYVSKQLTSPAQASMKSVALARLGGIELSASQAEDASPIKNIFDFAVGEAGRFAFSAGCHCDHAEDHALIVVDSHGALVRKIPLPARAKGGGTSDKVAWISADRWLVTTSTYGLEQPTSATWIDAGTGKTERIDGFVDAEIEALAASADGSFVALTRKNEKHSMTAGLAAFDNKGKPRWSVDQNYSDDRKLFSPEDVALTSAGEVVVLDVITHKLQVFGADGAWLRNLDLKELWGREPNYPSGIEADAGGGVIIHDFHGNPPIVRMALDGSIVDTFTPAFANGGTFEIRGNVQSAPDGRLWTSDGAALLRLDAKGKVDKIVGPKPDTESLGEIAALTVGVDQTIYAVDDRTGAVHVFDKDGQRLRVLKPAVGDYTGTPYDPSLTVMEDGDVYVARKGTGDESLDFLHYGPDGRRIGVVSLSLDDEVSQDWYAQPGGNSRLIVGYENAYRVDGKGAVLRKLERGADGQWLDKPSLTSVASNGGFAIVSGGPSARQLGNADSPPARVSLFSAHGDVRETWDAPEGLSFRSGAIAYDSQRLAFLVGAGDYEAATAVVITDPHGNPQFRFTPPADHPPGRAFLIRSDSGPELWLFDGKKQIDRYALPTVAASGVAR